MQHTIDRRSLPARPTRIAPALVLAVVSGSIAIAMAIVGLVVVYGI